jgi:hypothetical protein
MAERKSTKFRIFERFHSNADMTPQELAEYLDRFYNPMVDDLNRLVEVVNDLEDRVTALE